jgi:hypothetical protein
LAQLDPLPLRTSDHETAVRAAQAASVDVKGNPVGNRVRS